MIDPEEKVRRVELTKYKSEWSDLFIVAADEIRKILQSNCIDVHHVGSTAIPHIYAKPIIDIMPVVKNLNIVDSLAPKFESLGYVCMGEYGITGRRFYWKSKANRTHNIHLFQKDSHEIIRHVKFRDFMRKNQNYANAYSVIKCCLADVFPTDIESYVNGKASFVQMINYQTGTAKDKQLKVQDNLIIKLYEPTWPKLAEAEIKAIQTITNYTRNAQIEHIGSTAVPGLASRPIIDILITVQYINEAENWIAPLKSLGYLYWKDNPDKKHLQFFKGMPPFGETRTHHVHIVECNNDYSKNSISFRDYLRKNPKDRQRYSDLKNKLASQYSDDRETYTNGKQAFISSILIIAQE